MLKSFSDITDKLQANQQGLAKTLYGLIMANVVPHEQNGEAIMGLHHLKLHFHVLELSIASCNQLLFLNYAQWHNNFIQQNIYTKTAALASFTLMEKSLTSSLKEEEVQWVVKEYLKQACTAIESNKRLTNEVAINHCKQITSQFMVSYEKRMSG